MLISYFVPDLNDPAVRRRVAMFRTGGAEVRLIGFHRKASAAPIPGVSPVDLGRTTDGRMAARAVATIKAAMRARSLRSSIEGADIVVARNLEMLAVASRVRGNATMPLVYESLDIHRLMLGQGMASRLLRDLEGRLARRASLLLTSSPAFVESYFEPVSSVRLPVVLVENKVFLGDQTVPAPRPDRNEGEPWRIGWFGAIRCLKSFALLSRLTRALGGKVEVVIRGRPTAAVFPDFEALVAAEPYMRFGGAYRNPEDLAAIYGDVDFAWAIDYFEEGQNSEWLLPNRLYESGWGGAIPLALARTATGRWLREHGVGVTLPDRIEDALEATFRNLDLAAVREHRHRLAAIDPSVWLCLPQECAALVARMASQPPREDRPGHRAS
jgi:hypothetical protein